MAEIINLRLARKAQQRRAAEQTAAENRSRFGQTRGQKQLARSEADRINRDLEGARRETLPSCDGGEA